MSNKNLAYLLVFVLILLGLGQLAWHISTLPDQIATHFNAAGEPDGFSSKSSFALLQIGLLLGMPILLIGTGKLSQLAPESMVNIPHKEYWLHPDRRAATMSFVETMLAWITVGTQAFLMIIVQLTYQANMQQTQLAMIPFAACLIVYLVAIIGICIYMYTALRLPTEVQNT